MNQIPGRFARFATIALVAAGCSTGEASEEGPAIQTVEVTRGDLMLRAEASGQVEPVREVEVKSKASGEILRLHIDVGDHVEPGTLLAEIDPRDVQNRFDQAEADLDVAEARSEISQAQLGRSDQLLEAGVITQQENESARLDYANSRANLVKARTNYELAELQMNDVRIRAPMSGTIIQKNVEEGVVIQSASGNVSGGTTLFLMADLAEMQVRTLVDETDMGELQSGMVAAVQVEAFPDRTFRGVVEKIEPQATVEQNITMFPVIVSLDNRAGLLKPGMNAEVEISIDEAPNVLLVPNNAIVQTADVGPAAMALGLDIEAMDLTRFNRAGRGGFGGRGGGDGARRQGGNRGGGGQPGAEQQAGGGDQDAGTGGQQGTGGQRGAGQRGPAAAQIEALRARVQSGEMSQEEMRAAMQALRGQAGDFGAGDPGAAPPRQTRPAAVFVMGADSIPEPRLIQVGLNDWDFTQVTSGLEEGETLVVVGAAQLRASQEAFLAQMRDRMGGSPFGGGAPGGGRGFGGGRPR
jgi:HlyD family secretion protein